MSNHTHHVFFSYARADYGEDNNHFITRFYDLLRKTHEAFGGWQLRIIWNNVAITLGEASQEISDQEVRLSPLFLAFQLRESYMWSAIEAPLFCFRALSKLRCAYTVIRKEIRSRWPVVACLT